MADLNQFLRSKDRLTEILFCLNFKNTPDEKTVSYIEIIQTSIKTIDLKIAEFQNQRIEVGDQRLGEVRKSG